MKTYSIWLLVASLAISACGPFQTNTPTKSGADKNLCKSGKEFTAGETIELGETADFAAVLFTRDGSFEDDATLTVLLPDGSFSPSGSVLPKEGETGNLRWPKRVEVEVANCGGRYFYESTIYEVAPPRRDQTCADGFAGPTKPWPFFNEILLYRPGNGDTVWLYFGMGAPSLAEFVEGKLADSFEMVRPLDGESETAEISLARGGVLGVTLKNCHETLYYKAEWRAR